MEYIQLTNWEKYQHYKTRRPIWVKLYRDVLRDYQFKQLPDASKLLAYSLMVLAADQDNLIPNDHSWIRSETGIKGKIYVKELQAIGFIEVVQDASNPLADCKQNASLEKRREEKRREEEDSGWGNPADGIDQQAWNDWAKYKGGKPKKG